MPNIFEEESLTSMFFGLGSPSPPGRLHGLPPSSQLIGSGRWLRRLGIHRPQVSCHLLVICSPDIPRPDVSQTATGSSAALYIL
jgi:hypothetical protein